MMAEKKKPRTAGAGAALDTAFTERNSTAIANLLKLVTQAEKGGRHV